MKMDPPEDPTKWLVAMRGYKAFRPERKPEMLSLRTSQKQEDNPLATYEGEMLAGEFARAHMSPSVGEVWFQTDSNLV